MRRFVLIAMLLVACKSSDKPADKAAPAPPPAAPMKPAAPPIQGPHVDPTSFDRTCVAATDCVVVKPATCDPCACPTEAIASKDMAKFDEAAGKLACPPPDLALKCEPCKPVVASCSSGACTAAPK